MSKGFQKHEGVAAILMRDNVDTDQIIPSREMKTVSRTGLGEGLFAGLRYTDQAARTPNPGFVLNKLGLEDASVLISGANFGCGSSREHAVWALKEYGFRSIIAKSFGEIFYGNCLNNGILPIVLDEPLFDQFDSRLTISIDLQEQVLSSSQLPGWQASFNIDPYPKKLLSEGLDPIGLTLQNKPDIDGFLMKDQQLKPWLYGAV